MHIAHLQINADATVQRHLPDGCKQDNDASTQNEEDVRRRTDRETHGIVHPTDSSQRRAASVPKRPFECQQASSAYGRARRTTRGLCASKGWRVCCGFARHSAEGNRQA